MKIGLFDYENFLTTRAWRWVGMGYRPNGDGFGRFKNDITGQNVRVGAGEAGWNSKKETYKQACHRVFYHRLLEEEAKNVSNS